MADNAREQSFMPDDRAYDSDGDPLGDGEEKNVLVEGVDVVFWLRDAGFGDIAEPFLRGQEVPENRINEAVAALPSRYQEAVRKRVATLKDTVSTRLKKNRRPDIRSIFLEETSTEPAPPARARSFSAEKILDARYTSRDDTDHAIGHEPHIASYLIARNQDTSRFSKPVEASFVDHADNNILKFWAKKKNYRFPGATRNFGDEDGGVESLKYCPKGTIIKLPKPVPVGGVQSASPPRTSEVVRPTERSSPPRGLESSSEEAENARQSLELVTSGAGNSFQTHFKELETDFRSIQLGDVWRRDVREGITTIEDLSTPDAARVRQIAFLELTVLCDENDVRLVPKRRKFKKRQPRKKDDKPADLWGVELCTLVDRDREKGVNQDEDRVPYVLRKIIGQIERDGLSIEGIMRLSGNQAKVEALKSCLEKNLYSNPPAVDNGLGLASPHELCSLFKWFLRELPCPLIPTEYMDSFLKVLEINSLRVRVQALNLLVLLLPLENVCCFVAFLKLLKDIVDKESVNRMSLQNICHVMAPNIFLYPKSAANNDMHQQMAFAAKSSYALQHMVTWFDQLNVVPSDLLDNVRRQNELHLTKEAKRVLASKRFSSSKTFGPRLIHVKAMLCGPDPVEAEINPETTAGQVIHYVLESVMDKIDWNRRESGERVGARRRRVLSDLTNEHPVNCLLAAADPEIARRTHHLFEVGGNIVQRRLPANAVISAVLEVNPSCEFILRCAHRSAPTKPRPSK